MPKIDLVSLGCVDPKRQCEFYCSVLGMRDFGNFTVGYDNSAEAKLQFVASQHPYQSSPADLYWKIALATPNIELACRQLHQHGIEISQPHQFQDIGYLAHFNDPEGYTIELIDHWFEGQRPADNTENSELFGGGAHLNLLTLRANNIQPVHDLCIEAGMKQLVVEPVESHGFTLHFYAFTSQRPPNPDPQAVENRPWLYQRPYTILEIQHVPGVDVVNSKVEGVAGYLHATFSGVETIPAFNDLRLHS